MPSISAVLVLGGMLVLGAFFTVIELLLPWVLLAGFTYVGISVGRVIDTACKTKAGKFLVPIALLTAAGTWGILSYLQFSSLCEVAPARLLVGKVATRQAGFLVDDGNLRKIENGKEIKIHYHLLENRQIAYFDIFSKRFDPEASPNHIMRERKEISSKVAEPRSEYAFTVSPISHVGSWFLSPTYQLRYEILAVDTKEVFARSNEYVFGGGILGYYMHAVLGERGDYSEKDYKYLSCGHASKTPMAWRPHFSTNPNAENYLRTDMELISASLL